MQVGESGCPQRGLGRGGVGGSGSVSGSVFARVHWPDSRAAHHTHTVAREGLELRSLI
eukprot:COSAG02_NODE_117_length_35386_cov_78.819163_10_plen_58_part_00